MRCVLEKILFSYFLLSCSKVIVCFFLRVSETRRLLRLLFISGLHQFKFNVNDKCGSAATKEKIKCVNTVLTNC